MSAYKAVTLKCDGPLCNDEYNGDLDDTTAVVRRQAASIGWTSKGSKDFCPRHNPMDTAK